MTAAATAAPVLALQGPDLDAACCEYNPLGRLPGSGRLAVGVPAVLRGGVHAAAGGGGGGPERRPRWGAAVPR